LTAFLQSSLTNDYKLFIIGNSNKIFKATGIAENHPSVRIMEHINDQMLHSLYSKAEVVVSLSEYEGFGMSVLEGLYFGCKVLCSDIPVYRELYNNYVYICNQQNIKEIKEALERLVQSPVIPVSRDILLQKYNYTLSVKTILNHIA